VQYPSVYSPAKKPCYTNKHVYETALSEELEKFMNKDKKEGEMSKVPTFEVVKGKVVHPIKDANGRVTRKMHTFALEVKCEKHRTRFLRDLIFNADLDTEKFGRFIPYAMKWKETTYAQAVSSQNTFLHESMMIPIFGLHEDVLNEVSEGKTIMQWALEATVKGKSYHGRDILIHPIKSIERTSRTRALGKWHLMTKKHLEEAANAVFDRNVKVRGSRTKAQQKAVEAGECFSYGIRRNNVKLQLGETMEGCAANIDNWLRQEDDKGLVDEPPRKTGGFALVFDKNQFPELQSNEESATPSRKNPWQKRDEAKENGTVGGRSEQTSRTGNGSQTISNETVQTVLTQVFEQMDKRMADMAEANKQSTERLINQMNKTNESNAKGLGQMQRVCEQQQTMMMTLTVAMTGLLSSMGPAAEGIARQLEPMLQNFKSTVSVDEDEEEDIGKDEEIPMKTGESEHANKEQLQEKTGTTETEETAGPTAENTLKAQLNYTEKQVEAAAAVMDTSTLLGTNKKRAMEDRSTDTGNRSRGTTKVVVTPGPAAARVEMRNRRGQQERPTNPNQSNSPNSKKAQQRHRSKSKERKKDSPMESLDPTHGGLVHTDNTSREAGRQNQGGRPSKRD
jgi:hypothetical protein